MKDLFMKWVKMQNLKRFQTPEHMENKRRAERLDMWVES